LYFSTFSTAYTNRWRSFSRDTADSNYWKYLKAKLKKENSELVSVNTQLKLLASDGKRYITDMLDYQGIIALVSVTK
jgi:hypothetical protein